MNKPLYILISLMLLTLLSACSTTSHNVRQITPFSYTDQHEQSFGTDHLAGKVWIANFIFTNCESVCSPMTMEMASLQKKLAEEAIEVEFVSFTVDPQVDSPKVLQSYIGQFTDDVSNWHLLTGYTQDEIEVFAREQFQTIIHKPESSQQVIHGSNFYLVDDRGNLVNEVNYVEPSFADNLISDIRKLQSRITY